jgi:hypothetical protein
MTHKNHRKPTPTMIRVLHYLNDGLPAHYRCRGRSEYGGRTSTLTALYRSGLIDKDHQVTAAGQRLLRQHGR